MKNVSKFVPIVMVGISALSVASPLLAHDGVERTRRAILPVAGSVRGAFDSNFKTEVQINNRSAQAMKGMLVFHPAGRSGDEHDPSVAYSLEPNQTLHFEDLVAHLGQSGLGSIDVLVEGKGVPTIVARAYDDKGDGGTTGATIAPVRVEDALVAGESSTLIAPADRQRFRFNIGVRTLTATTVDVEIYNDSGVKRKTTTLTFPADYFVQNSADALLGETIVANEAVVFHVKEGSVIVYGTTTDNATNDPSVQIAPKPLPVAN